MLTTRGDTRKESKVKTLVETANFRKTFSKKNVLMKKKAELSCGEVSLGQ